MLANYRTAIRRTISSSTDLSLLDFQKNSVMNGTSRHHEREATQGTSLQPLSALTFATERDYFPTLLVSKAVPLPPRRDASSLKHHRRRPPADQSPPVQPLLNSSTLDDLFRALTLECEQYLAATSISTKKSKDSIISQSSSSRQTAVESNDDDYENLHKQTSQPRMNGASTLKTSIEVISPIKRHVVSISVSSKVSKPVRVPSPVITAPTPVVETRVSRSSEEEPTHPSSSSTTNNNRRRRRRTRKRMISSTTTRSSSSSKERAESIAEKKPLMSKRSCSTDHRRHRSRDLHEHPSFSSPKTTPRRVPRRDVSLQHSFSTRSAVRPEHSSPLSVLLTASSNNSKSTSDFLDACEHRPRRSRFESVMQKPLSLLDRMHQQFYRLSPTRTPKSTNIPTHRVSSYRVH